MHAIVDVFTLHPALEFLGTFFTVFLCLCPYISNQGGGPFFCYRDASFADT